MFSRVWAKTPTILLKLLIGRNLVKWGELMEGGNGMFIIITILILGLLWFGVAYFKLQKQIDLLRFEQEQCKQELADFDYKKRQVFSVIQDALLILDSNGKVKTINQIGEKLLGWSQAEVEGKPYLSVYRSVTQAIVGERDSIGELLADFADPFLNIGQEDVLYTRNHLILTTKDGQKLTVTDRVKPLFNSQMQFVGVLCTFRDLTPKEAKQVRLSQLSRRDSLTGLYNRGFFDQKLPELDQPEHWPLSIILGDLNGLKLTNDIFGHAVGDQLLIMVAQTLKEVFRPSDLIFRWGGDEFVILLPQTSMPEAERLLERLQLRLATCSIGPMALSLPLGVGSKETGQDDFQTAWNQAEEQMYWKKTVGRASFQKDTLENIQQELYARSVEEKHHAERVANLSEEFGLFLGFSPDQQYKLHLAGIFHDIGKIALDPELLYRAYPLRPVELREMQRHPLVGFRLLNFFEETADLAGPVLAHHEHWDGSGYPKGLKGEEISLYGRILAIIETYDRVLYTPYGERFTQTEALEIIAEESGRKFDPQLTTAFLTLMSKEKAQFN